MDRKKRGCCCAVSSCRNTATNCKISFFRFPKNLERAQLWARACQREDLLNKRVNLNNYRVCGIHFQEPMFLNFLKNRLQPHAVPILYLDDSAPPPYFEIKIEEPELADDDLTETDPLLVPQIETTEAIITEPCVLELFEESLIKSEPTSSVEEIAIQTPNILSMYTPRMVAYRKKLKALQRSNIKLKKELDNVFSLCGQFLPSDTVQFIRKESKRLTAISTKSSDDSVIEVDLEETF